MATYHLAYGRDGLPLTLSDDANVTVVEPAFTPALPYQTGALRDAVENPMKSPPLRELVSAGDSVVIVFSDITRPTPNHLILPVVLEAIAHVPPENITLIDALGTHRENTIDELNVMLGADIVKKYRIIQNNAFDEGTQVQLGETSRGHEVWVNKTYMEADVKILTDFIEPHVFAGFSGGGKIVMPGVAGRKSIYANHGADMIGHPKASWGVTWGNPIWEEMREIALMTEPTFSINVTLNRDKAITGVFAGDLDAAHAAGMAHSREIAMVGVDEPFDIVISTNSGYPLDLNLYQTGKGMSAAAQIVREGGAIIVASECSEGIPDHGQYGQILHEVDDPAKLMDYVYGFEHTRQDQWQAQIQAKCQAKADIYIYAGGLTAGQIRGALLLPCEDIAATVESLRGKFGRDARICVLPEGPQTIPYVKEKAASA